MVLSSAFSCVDPALVDDPEDESFSDCSSSGGKGAPLRSSRSEPIPRSADQEDVCWICLDPAGAHGTLERPCACPRSVHAMCLARWQLHSAGRDEERVCRFCHTELRDWKPVMTQATGAKVVTPYMRVSFGGKTYKVQVQPGPEGAAAFERQIRSLLQLPEGLEFDVIFHCRAPGTGDKLQLQGLNAFDAAVHCASLSNKTPSSSQAAAAGDRKAPRKAAGAFGRLLAALGCRTGADDAQPGAA
ncbi:hypothetical protein MNEG_0912 [Monoraphidium neglectum]|uniref:RING-CH-type domain-containing protein n=1 Tax=Monoraphidium neglectum TaxID=145388 RepID=A0A0D2NRY1_9CHLO|nr:hypothetical protein MNEG_0912 [Monoraphidium neglectum]KIZ07041.1 hypothetical protein MNEG_0912 [Monoraphidium neglectum]|eukprot:XP_013906060.1 hypothetical protein MNEG_0912 [Monoraphidium neglectum]